MKKLFTTGLLAIALLFGTRAYAQDSRATFGVKGGFNLSNMVGDIEHTDPKSGFQFGLTLDYSLSNNVYLLTGMELTTKGAKERREVKYETQYMGTAYTTANITYSPVYFQIPVHIGYKVNATEKVKIVLHTGPYVAYGLSGKIKSNFNTYAIEDTKTNIFSTDGLKDFDFGFGVGTGAEWNKLVLNIGYDFGVANILDKAKDERGRLKNTNAYITLGYKF